MPDISLQIRSNPRPIKVTRGADGVVGTLSGYIAVFDDDSYDLGGYVERVARGAFRASLQNTDVVALVNHNHSQVVGRLSAGTLTLLEDDHGLAFSVDLPDTQQGRDLKVLVERGDLSGCSFGFNILAETWEKDVCTLTEVDLMEVSLGVTFPAYPNTSMELRKQSHLDKLRVRCLVEHEKRKLKCRYNVVK